MLEHIDVSVGFQPQKIHKCDNYYLPFTNQKRNSILSLYCQLLGMVRTLFNAMSFM